jgi:parvulin-like peptidyl-prolyl isomerase
MSKIGDFRKQVESGLQKKSRVSMKSITALVLFGAIILVFVFFGLPNSMNAGAGGGGSAAQVNNSLISAGDLINETTRLEQMYAPLFGGQTIGEAQRQFLRQQALESLIAQELVAQNAKKEGILATDAEIQDFIVKEMTAFQKDGRFQRDLYFQILQANRLNAAEFEEKIRKERKNMRTRRMFEIAALPLDLEVSKLKALQEKKLNVSFAKFNKEDLKGKTFSAAQVSSKLAEPEFLKKVEDYYNSNKSEFAKEAQVRAQHILIKVDGTTTDAKAQSIISDIKKRAVSEDFGKLAQEFSMDPGSKAKGGDLGFFGPGKMEPSFEKAAFTQAVGVVGEAIKTPFGYHLIKVTDKKEAQQLSFDEVKNQIAGQLIASESFDANVAKLDEALAQGKFAEVDALVKALGASWEETGFFDASADMIPKLGSQEASQAAFSVSENKPFYPKIVRDGAEKFVLKFKASKAEAAADTKTLSAQLARERSGDLFGNWIEEAKKSAHIERNPQILSTTR